MTQLRLYAAPVPQPVVQPEIRSLPIRNSDLMRLEVPGNIIGGVMTLDRRPDTALLIARLRAMLRRHPWLLGKRDPERPNCWTFGSDAIPAEIPSSLFREVIVDSPAFNPIAVAGARKPRAFPPDAPQIRLEVLVHGTEGREAALVCYGHHALFNGVNLSRFVKGLTDQGEGQKLCFPTADRLGSLRGPVTMWRIFRLLAYEWVAGHFLPQKRPDRPDNAPRWIALSHDLKRLRHACRERKVPFSTALLAVLGTAIGDFREAVEGRRIGKVPFIYPLRSRSRSANGGNDDPTDDHLPLLLPVSTNGANLKRTIDRIERFEQRASRIATREIMEQRAGLYGALPKAARDFIVSTCSRKTDALFTITPSVMRPLSIGDAGVMAIHGLPAILEGQFASISMIPYCGRYHCALAISGGYTASECADFERMLERRLNWALDELAAGSCHSASSRKEVRASSKCVDCAKPIDPEPGQGMRPRGAGS